MFRERDEDYARSSTSPGYLALALALVMVFLVGFSEEELVSASPDEEVRFAVDYLDSLRLRNYNYLYENAHKELRKRLTEHKLNEIAGQFPIGDPLSVFHIRSLIELTSGAWNARLTFEYEFSEGWAVASVSLVRDGGNLAVTAFKVEQTAGSQEALNEFTLQDKSVSHYVTLGLAVVVPLFIIATAIVCVRTPMRRRKWLWMLFVLFGAGKVSLNWTTGAFSVKALSFLLLGTSAGSVGPSSPWIIAAAVPLGAMVFWIERTSLIADAQSNAEEAQD